MISEVALSEKNKNAWLPLPNNFGNVEVLILLNG